MKNTVKAFIKRFVLVITLVSGMSLLANAQDRQPKSPAEKADRSTKVLQKQLNLSANQTTQVNAVYLEQFKGLDSLRTVNQGGDKKANQQLRKTFIDQADTKLNAIFTDEQKVAYTTFMQTQKDKAAARKGNLPGITNK